MTYTAEAVASFLVAGADPGAVWPRVTRTITIPCPDATTPAEAEMAARAWLDTYHPGHQVRAITITEDGAVYEPLL